MEKLDQTNRNFRKKEFYLFYYTSMLRQEKSSFGLLSSLRTSSQSGITGSSFSCCISKLFFQQISFLFSYFFKHEPKSCRKK